MVYILVCKLAQTYHKSLDPTVLAARVRSYLKAGSFAFDRIAVLLFWGRSKYTSVLEPYLVRELLELFW